MASSYINDLRLELIAVGEGAGSAPNDWGSKTNINLINIAAAFGPGTENLASDANATLTLTDGTADAMKSLCLKVTSGVSLTAPRVISIAPNTVAKLWFIENATSGGQSLVFSQGSGGNVTIPNGQTKVVYSDGAGSGAAVVDALTDLNISGTTVLANATVSTTATVGGVTNGVEITQGAIALKNGGTQSKIDFYCESSNAHYTRLQSAPHSAYSGNITLTLPASDGNADQVLATDGNGVMSWATLASGYPAPTLIGTSGTVASSTFQVATAGSITITLPASPSAGDYVVVKDGTGAAATTNFTVARNGSNIASSATDLTFDKNFAEIVMTYVNSTIGWSV